MPINKSSRRSVHGDLGSAASRRATAAASSSRPRAVKSEPASNVSRDACWRPAMWRAMPSMLSVSARPTRSLTSRYRSGTAKRETLVRTSARPSLARPSRCTMKPGSEMQLEKVPRHSASASAASTSWIFAARMNPRISSTYRSSSDGPPTIAVPTIARTRKGSAGRILGLVVLPPSGPWSNEWLLS